MVKKADLEATVSEHRNEHAFIHTSTKRYNILIQISQLLRSFQ